MECFILAFVNFYKIFAVCHGIPYQNAIEENKGFFLIAIFLTTCSYMSPPTL